jgi:glycosyltransferase involved in cell wall biosynthesis
VLTPNGIDPRRFVPDGSARALLRTETGTAESTVVVLFLGGDWDRKGLPAAIEGVGAARRRGADVALWVVGAGDAERFTTLAGASGLENHIRFFGRRSDTERYYAAADLFVAPTLYETFSIAGYEAAACGLPVIATRVNGLEDLVGDGEERGRFISSDGPSIEHAVTELAASSSTRRELGARAREFAKAYGWDRSASAVLAAYERILTSGSKR